MSAHRTIHTHITPSMMMITSSTIIVAAILFSMTGPALFTKGVLTFRRDFVTTFVPV